MRHHLALDVEAKTSQAECAVSRIAVWLHSRDTIRWFCLGSEPLQGRSSADTRLTYRDLGRDFRLTDVGGSVVKKMLV